MEESKPEQQKKQFNRKKMSSPKELQFNVKNVYGRLLYYPKNDWAHLALDTFACNKTRARSFSREQVLFLKQMGVAIKIVSTENLKVELDIEETTHE